MGCLTFPMPVRSLNEEWKANMVSCDCCGKRVDERSMATVDTGTYAFFVCQACRGMYDNQELLEKCEEQAEQSGKPDSTTGEPKPGIVPKTRS